MLDDSSDKSRSWPIRWWQALSFCIGAYLFTSIILSLISKLINNETNLGIVVLYIISSVVLLLATGSFLALRKISIKELLGRFYIQQAMLVPIYYVVYIALSRVIQAIISLFPNVDISQKQDFGIQSDSIIQLVIIFFALVILPAVTEELLFRGLLYKSLKKQFGKVLAAILVSLLFGLAHGQWNVAADTFVLSLVLVYMVEKNNSLWPSISLHLLKNLVAFLLVFVFHVA